MTGTSIHGIHGIHSTDDPAADPTFADGWFEACVEHRGADADAPCAHCGWLPVDHTAGLAEVIAVGRPTVSPRLRRAS